MVKNETHAQSLCRHKKRKEIKLLEIFDTIISVLQSNENTEEKIKNKVIKRARYVSKNSGGLFKVYLTCLLANILIY